MMMASAIKAAPPPGATSPRRGRQEAGGPCSVPDELVRARFYGYLPAKFLRLTISRGSVFLRLQMPKILTAGRLRTPRQSTGRSGREHLHLIKAAFPEGPSGLHQSFPVIDPQKKFLHLLLIQINAEKGPSRGARDD